MSIRFTQSCPTCGRRVQVRASLIGYTVACQHCNAEFVARCDDEPTTPEVTEGFPGGEVVADPLMARVEIALERAAKEKTAVTQIR